MTTRERTVEDQLRRSARALNGWADKLIPSRAGMPDRMVILPGRVRLVELKAPGGRLRPDQRVYIDRCAERGITVDVLSSVEEVKAWARDQASWVVGEGSRQRGRPPKVRELTAGELTSAHLGGVVRFSDVLGKVREGDLRAVDHRPGSVEITLHNLGRFTAVADTRCVWERVGGLALQ